MRTYTFNNGEVSVTLPYPIIYLRDFNALTFQLNIAGVKSSNAELIMTLRKPDSTVLQRTFFVTTLSDTIVFDLSYWLTSEEVGTLTAFSITYGYTRSDGATVASANISQAGLNIRLSNGYSLPNRQHYSETSVYAPPLAVYKKGMNLPNATEVELEFGAPAPIIINGQRYNKDDNFTVTPSEEDCKIIADVEVLGTYNAWGTATYPHTYGVSCIWLNHITVGGKSNLIREYENAFQIRLTDQESQLPLSRVIADEDVSDMEDYACTDVVLGIVLRATNNPLRWEVFGLTCYKCQSCDSDVCNYMRLFTSGNILNSYVVECDEFSDFLSVDYGDMRGTIPNFEVKYIEGDGFATDVIGIKIRNSHYHDATSGTFQTLTDFPLAIGSVIMGLNTNVSTFDLWENLGITPLSGIRECPAPYDYTIYSPVPAVLWKLCTLNFGYTNSTHIGSISAGLENIFRQMYSNADVYFTLKNHDAPQRGLYVKADGGSQRDTYFPYGGESAKNVLWQFLNLPSLSTTNFNGYTYLGVTDAGTLAEVRGYSSKNYDNAIYPTDPLGVSVIRMTTSFKTIVGGVGNWLTNEQDVILIKVCGENNTWFIPNVLLSRYVGGTLNYYAPDGTILNVNPNNPFDVEGDYVYPTVFSVFIQDPDNALMSLVSGTPIELEGYSPSLDAEVLLSDVMRLNNDAQKAHYRLFPYNCNMPVQKIDDFDISYMAQPSELVFASDDRGVTGFVTEKGYFSPFNVGRNNIMPIYPEVTREARFSNEQRHNITDWSVTQITTTAPMLVSTMSMLYSLLSQRVPLLMPVGVAYQDQDLITNANMYGEVIAQPCTQPEATVIDFLKGDVTQYNIVSYSLCDTDQVFWLKYENMDGFVRWLPFEIKRRVYENTMGDFKFTTPMQSVINAYPMQAPLTLQEKITCFIGDVPQDLYIEDILYSPYLTGINFDGSVSFECVVEENEVVRDCSQELEDFVFNFIKKK